MYQIPPAHFMFGQIVPDYGEIVPDSAEIYTCT